MFFFHLRDVNDVWRSASWLGDNLFDRKNKIHSRWWKSQCLAQQESTRKIIIAEVIGTIIYLPAVHLFVLRAALLLFFRRPKVLTKRRKKNRATRVALLGNSRAFFPPMTRSDEQCTNFLALFLFVYSCYICWSRPRKKIGQNNQKSFFGGEKNKI